MQPYLEEDLCRDLEELLLLEPSKPEHHDLWVEKAAAIRRRLDSKDAFWDDERSQSGLIFSGIRSYLDDARFMAKHPDYYATESAKVRASIDRYRQYSATLTGRHPNAL